MSRQPTAAVPRPSAGSSPPRKQVSVLRFLREVRGELRRVSWPSRSDVVSYTIVVLIAVVALTAMVFALDQLFSAGALWLFA